MAAVGTKVPNKPAAAGVASPLAIVGVWIAGQFGVEMPPEVAASFALLLPALAYWLYPAGES